MQNTSSKKQASPRKRVSPAKKKLALEVIGRLKKEYPVAECTLDYENAWQLLVSVRLAAQCTDARVDQITPLLYEKFPDVPALAAAEPEQPPCRTDRTTLTCARPPYRWPHTASAKSISRLDRPA